MGTFRLWRGYSRTELVDKRKACPLSDFELVTDGLTQSTIQAVHGVRSIDKRSIYDVSEGSADQNVVAVLPRQPIKL